MSSDRAPLVSVAIPLFKSKRFLNCIVGNIEAIDYPNIEIIISDRHGADETIDLLYHRFGDDPRFEFIKSSDQLNWVHHYNLLLRIASGQYFLWMPHDDVYPSNYIPELVTTLEQRPEAILAFGRMEHIYLDGSPLTHRRVLPPPISDQEPWSFGLALRILLWGAGRPFRGLFRRDVVVESGLYIRPTHETVIADVLWGFALSLKGRFCFVPSCTCQKRRYPDSTHMNWRVGIRHRISTFLVSHSYLRDLCSSRTEVLFGTLFSFVWHLNRAAGTTVPGSNLVRKSTGKFLKWIVLYKMRGVTA